MFHSVWTNASILHMYFHYTHVRAQSWTKLQEPGFPVSVLSTSVSSKAMLSAVWLTKQYARNLKGRNSGQQEPRKFSMGSKVINLWAAEIVWFNDIWSYVVRSNGCRTDREMTLMLLARISTARCKWSMLSYFLPAVRMYLPELKSILTSCWSLVWLVSFQTRMNPETVPDSQQPSRTI